MLTLAILFILNGLLLIILAIPMIQEWVKPNWIYGFRIPKTVNNPHLWYPANKYAGKWLVGLGLLSVILGIAALAFPDMNVDAYGIVVAIVILIYCLVMTIATFRYLNTLS